METPGELGCLPLTWGPWQAEFTPTYGMNTLSLRWQGQRILRTPPSAEAFLALPEAYGTPPLMPANRTRDGRFTFEGRTYQLPVNDDRYHTHKHGSLHRSPFVLTERTSCRAVGSLVNRGQLYPFPFQMEIVCELGADGYRQTFTLFNTGSENMPVIFAVHAAFVRPERCRIPLGKLWVADDRCIPTGALAPLPSELLPYTDGRPLPPDPVGACCTSGGRCAWIGPFCYEVCGLFREWIVWNGSGAEGFLCVEPQSAPSNALNVPGEALCVAPGARLCFQTRIFRPNPAGEIQEALHADP